MTEESCHCFEFVEIFGFLPLSEAPGLVFENPPHLCLASELPLSTSGCKVFRPSVLELNGQADVLNCPISFCDSSATSTRSPAEWKLFMLTLHLYVPKTLSVRISAGNGLLPFAPPVAHTSHLLDRIPSRPFCFACYNNLARFHFSGEILPCGL